MYAELPEKETQKAKWDKQASVVEFSKVQVFMNEAYKICTDTVNWKEKCFNLKFKFKH